MKKLVCPECGKEFETSHPKKRYCSCICQRKHNAKIQNAKKAKPVAVKKCLVCGKEFVSRSVNHKYCCRHCKDKAYHRIYDKEHKQEISKRMKRYYQNRKIQKCSEAHGMCLECDTPDGECLFD